VARPIPNPCTKERKAACASPTRTEVPQITASSCGGASMAACSAARPSELRAPRRPLLGAPPRSDELPLSGRERESDPLWEFLTYRREGGPMSPRRSERRGVLRNPSSKLHTHTDWPEAKRKRTGREKWEWKGRTAGPSRARETQSIQQGSREAIHGRCPLPGHAKRLAGHCRCPVSRGGTRVGSPGRILEVPTRRATEGWTTGSSRSSASAQGSNHCPHHCLVMQNALTWRLADRLGLAGAHSSLDDDPSPTDPAPSFAHTDFEVWSFYGPND
jgi:hypothetical protein